MRYFPINIDIRNRQAVVIGGGRVAFRKITALHKADADVKVISPSITNEIEGLLSQGLLQWIEREYQSGDLDDAFLAFVAVDDRDVGRAVSIEATRLSIPLNVADIPDLCTFTIPSVAERGDLLIAVSTGGKCPALARHVRLEVEEKIDSAYATLLTILGEAREKLIDSGIGSDKCRDLLNNLIDSAMLAQIRSGQVADAEQIAKDAVENFLAEASKKARS